MKLILKGTVGKRDFLMSQNSKYINKNYLVFKIVANMPTWIFFSLKNSRFTIKFLSIFKNSLNWEIQKPYNNKISIFIENILNNLKKTLISRTKIRNLNEAKF
jgi:hypothetical protein